MGLIPKDVKPGELTHALREVDFVHDRTAIWYISRRAASQRIDRGGALSGLGMHESAILSKIVLPLVRPALTALAILIFRAAWDLYVWPLIIITSESIRPLTVGIVLFMSNYGTDWKQLLAIATIAMLPMVFIFLMLRRYFVRGIVLSGIEG